MEDSHGPSQLVAKHLWNRPLGCWLRVWARKLTWPGRVSQLHHSETLGKLFNLVSLWGPSEYAHHSGVVRIKLINACKEFSPVSGIWCSINIGCFLPWPLRLLFFLLQKGSGGRAGSARENLKDHVAQRAKLHSPTSAGLKFKTFCTHYKSLPHHFSFSTGALPPHSPFLGKFKQSTDQTSASHHQNLKRTWTCSRPFFPSGIWKTRSPQLNDTLSIWFCKQPLCRDGFPLIIFPFPHGFVFSLCLLLINN